VYVDRFRCVWDTSTHTQPTTIHGFCICLYTHTHPQPSIHPSTRLYICVCLSICNQPSLHPFHKHTPAAAVQGREGRHFRCRQKAADAFEGEDGFGGGGDHLFLYNRECLHYIFGLVSSVCVCVCVGGAVSVCFNCGVRHTAAVTQVGNRRIISFHL
jgi:hypothetical protein